jgi:hypothetical protein
MKIYKELEALGFFKWYCTQYGGLVYQEYKPVYDDLPLDNLIRTELNACAFKFFREQYFLDSYIVPAPLETKKVYDYYIWFTNEKQERDLFIGMNNQYTYEEAEVECLKKLISITEVCNQKL